MTKHLQKFTAILLAVIMTLGVFTVVPFTASAAETYKIMNPTPFSDNNHFVQVENGFLRVFYDDVDINIEYYDNNFNIVSKHSVEMELPLWGGFYKGNDAYYIVEGKNNLEEDDNAEVIRVIKYDFEWNRIASTSITNELHMWEGKQDFPLTPVI